MNNALIDQKIREIKKLLEMEENKITDSFLKKFSITLKEFGGWNSLRINPIQFAEINGLDTDETIRIFIYGAKVGLFTFEWNLLCPLCGGREHSHQSLNQLEKETYHCSFCDIDVEVEADSHLEVSFSLPPSISRFIPKPYRSLQEYLAYYFSSNIVWTPEISDAFERQQKLQFITLPPGKKTSLRLEITPVKKYRIISLETHSIFTIQMEGRTGNTVNKINLENTDKGFAKRKEIIPGNMGNG